MHPDVQKLLEVQKVDRELARVRNDLASLPREEAKRRKRLEQLQAAVEERRRDVNEAELKSRNLDLNIHQADDEIKKLQVRLNTVKNNAEYQATLLQIEAVKKERNEMEEQGLAIIDQLEGLRQTAEEAEAELKGEQTVFDEFAAKATALRRQLEEELSAVGEGREELAAQVPPDLMDRYERLFDVRDRMPVCAVEGQVCTGCYTQVTTNDLARLMSRRAIVQCGSCQRILYLPE